MLRRPLLRLAGVLGVTVAGVVACQDSSTDLTGLEPAYSHTHSPAASRAATSSVAAANKELAALRLATARYHDVETALADGYVADAHCVSAPPGGMGFHYVNPAHVDLDVDPSKPDVLLYEPMDDGGLRLVGAEFLVHGDAWDAMHSEAPSFAGVAFDPPTDRSAMAPPGPFYTLHVWIWKENPDGMFAPFNPRVTCG
jgi:hypothetical protein